MPFLKRYTYALLSFVSMIVSVALFYQMFIGGNFFRTPSYFVSFLVPALSAFGIFAAFKSKRLNEASWVGAALGTIGILVLVCILIFYAYVAVVGSACAPDLAGC